MADYRLYISTRPPFPTIHYIAPPFDKVCIRLRGSTGSLQTRGCLERDDWEQLKEYISKYTTWDV